MTIPFLPEYDEESISDKAKWKIIGDAIDYGISESIAQNQVKSALRSNGFTFGNTPFSSLWQNLSDYRVRFEYPSILPDRAIPDIDRMYGTQRLQSGVFQYKGSVTVYDENNDTLKQQYFTINTTDLLTGEQAKDMLYEYGLPQSPIAGEIISSITYEGALKGIG